MITAALHTSLDCLQFPDASEAALCLLILSFVGATMLRTFHCRLLSVLALCFGCSTAALEPTRDEPITYGKEYQNPVDQKTYVAEGGWRLYKPDTPRPRMPWQKVRTKAVRLLMSDDDIAAQTTVMELATFVKEAERLADETFNKSDQEATVLVQFDCIPSGHQVRIAYQGEVSQELLQQYYDALKGVTKLPVKNDKVVFQLELLVNQ